MLESVMLPVLVALTAPMPEVVAATVTILMLEVVSVAYQWQSLCEAL